MELSEAISVPPNPDTTNLLDHHNHSHSHSELGFLPSSPDPQPTPYDLDHAVLDELQQLEDLKDKEEKEELQKLELKEEENDELDGIQKLDLKEGGEKDELDGIRKLDLKEEEKDEVEEFQKLDVKDKEDEVEEEPEKSSNGRENEDENENEDEDEIQSEQSSGGGGGGGENQSEDGGEFEAKAEGSSRRYQYPVRPEAEDCSYYIKTGNCKFGSNCKFNHPVRRKNNNQVSKDKVKEREELTEKPGQTECKYYLRSGGCKYGKACRYNHSRGKPSVAPVLELNFLGLPIRPGERECPYYMRNGSCKYASNCRFNHPDPTAGGSDSPSGYGNGGPPLLQGASQATVATWSAPRSLNETPIYMSMMIPPSQGAPSQKTEWNGYQGPAYLPERSMPARPPYIMNNSVTDTNIYNPYPQQKQVEEFPERPGQPPCSYFLRTGDCKFKSNCKFHHPKTPTAVTPSYTLSDKGLPLRPDQIICTHYSRYGICKFGPACKFDHPLHITSSTTSGLDHQLPFSESTSTNGAGIAGSRSGADATVQPQPVISFE